MATMNRNTSCFRSAESRKPSSRVCGAKSRDFSTSWRRNPAEQLGRLGQCRIERQRSTGFNPGGVGVFVLQIRVGQGRMRRGRLRTPQRDLERVDRLLHAMIAQVNASHQKMRLRLVRRQVNRAIQLVDGFPIVLLPKETPAAVEIEPRQLLLIPLAAVGNRGVDLSCARQLHAIVDALESLRRQVIGQPLPIGEDGRQSAGQIRSREASTGLPLA